MSILVDKKTRVLIQGVTGREGSRACREMQKYGTQVLAGVTPGKGGGRIEGILVFDTVAEALARHPHINATLITVPAAFARDAALEAIFARIPLVVVLTEHVPISDTALMIGWARKLGVRLVGPSSVGIISPRIAKIGSIGSSEIHKVFTPGPIGIISKSGGMTAEIAHTLTTAHIGQSTAIGIGGDQLIGFDFADALELFGRDVATKAIVMFGEIGGTYEERAAEFIVKYSFKKPVIALIAGKFTQAMPKETVLGHAGAIVAQGRGSFDSKTRALDKAGVGIVRRPEDIPIVLKKLLNI